ncbi:DUF4062 domain-containing protein [Aeromonas jandaei]|uniref:DUF4062 domain-containing protein n=1 Tax=Aeromonas jandaei TaxID=650 RepID=A0ABD7ESL6_AERJA|nr:DUF4062 domain-containing protein [Aeromonas jandaei]QWL64038.1 DUF4062 domain-containing protein [Aeromonas jandaei]
MAIPRVFISSTCYDLKHIRESLKYFVRTIGYEPVLSDDGDVFYSPDTHTHESCLKEVETCQIFILIIGGRYGGKYMGRKTSITNNEYKTAVENNIPIFALVEQGVYSEHHVYSTNKKSSSEIANQITYPSVDNIMIFDFVDEVRRNVKNNAIYAFRDFSDIEEYLKKQWAGMMYDFITNRARDDRNKVTNRLLDDLNLATKKTEELLKLIARQGSDKPDSKIEEQISRIDKVTDLVKTLKKFINYIPLNLMVADVDAKTFSEKVLASDNWTSFVKSFPSIDFEISENMCTMMCKDIMPSGYTSIITEKHHLDIVAELFNSLKASDESELIQAYNELMS